MAQHYGGRGGPRRSSSTRAATPQRDPDSPRGDGERLRRELRGMHGSGYGRYKPLTGIWRFDQFCLQIQRVQPDPYAPASRVQVTVDAATAALPTHLWDTPVRARALAGYLARALHRELADSRLRVDAGGQEVLDRSSCQIHDGTVRVRLGIDLPGRGRSIDGHAAAHTLCDQLPDVVDAALRWEVADQAAAEEFVRTVVDTDALRRALPDLGLVAFVADGAMLARRSGVDDRALPDGVPFASPDSMRVSVDLPHRGRVTGMGVPEGITLIVGGGFHGKSTLLRALEHGVYDHVPGDGRELVVARDDAVKVRAEDGRRVHRVDVSPFVSHLPTGADTRDFSTDNASGSTSQAAAITEAVEAGAGVLLVDEDTAATNLMIRDARMQALVAKDAEPLTPFVDLIRPLHTTHAVSTVLVMGGSGDYMDVADRVLMLDAYRAHDVTDRARELARDRPTGRRSEADGYPPLRHRVVHGRSIPTERPKIRARGTDALTVGESTIELRGVEQIADSSQVTGIGLALVNLARRGRFDRRVLAEVLREWAADVAERGVAAVDERFVGDFAVPRPLEVAAALNRLRVLAVQDLRG